MFKFDEWWMPDGETQLPAWMTTINHRVEGRLTWQYHKYAAALALCRQRRVALDIGAHVGLLSYWMARDFERVEAFEPSADARDCWQMNVTADHARLHPVALGLHPGHVELVTTPGESGGTYVVETAIGQEQRPLDSYDFPVIDFVKIDCEGYEPAVLEGAMLTMLRCRPVVLVEQHANGHQGRYGYTSTAATDILISLGASIRTVLGSDVIMEFQEG